LTKPSTSGGGPGKVLPFPGEREGFMAEGRRGCKDPKFLWSSTKADKKLPLKKIEREPFRGAL